MTRHFLRDDHLSAVQQREVLELAAKLKQNRFAHRPLAGPQSVALVFDKPSTRTRVSFSVGIAELGGFPLIMDAVGNQLARGESVADTTRVLSRQCSAIVWRTFDQSRLIEAAAHSTVPVINALSDSFHPCQVLADLFTVSEHFGEFSGRTFTFLGDAASNMASSYALALAIAGAHTRFCAPVGYQPDPAVLTQARSLAAATNGSVSLISDPQEAVRNADVLATDSWISMGQEGMREQRLADFAGYQLTTALVGRAAPHAVVLHCLPAHRGEEITAQVLDGPRSLIWNQAENRLHVQKALLSWALERG
ncbi:MAG: ornithine carbamoyltransferase [Acidimicrobiales bacterium]|nr:MAG: ornithine carbamoyltransferase [Acidimicrobiales bacterium]